MQEHLKDKDEVTIKEAFELCFPQETVDGFRTERAPITDVITIVDN